MTCQCVCILQVAMMTHNLFVVKVPLATISNFHSASRQVFNAAAKGNFASIRQRPNPQQRWCSMCTFLIFIFWEISRAAQEGQVYGWMLVQTPNPIQPKSAQIVWWSLIFVFWHWHMWSQSQDGAQIQVFHCWRYCVTILRPTPTSKQHQGLATQQLRTT